MVLAPELLEVLEKHKPLKCHRFSDPASGLFAFVVIDNLKLGPAAGGVRTMPYETDEAALRDACRLARTMSIKCAIAGVDAGGGKAVVVEDEKLDRARAFEVLGAKIESLGGEFRTAGNLGTRPEDLRAMARRTQYVHADTETLAAAVARGVLRCAEACADMHGRPGIVGLRIAVQGCGDIGAAVARAFSEAGAELVLSDLVDERARTLAAALGAEVVRPEDLLASDVDIVAPCAVGDVLSVASVATLRAWGVVGAANNQCVDRAAHRAMHERKILHVPDLVASGGAVIEGIGKSVMGLEDRGPLIDALGATAHDVLEEAARTGEPPVVHAIERAIARIDQADD